MLLSILFIIAAKLAGELAVFYYMSPRLRAKILSYPSLVAFTYLALNLWLSGTGVLAVTGSLASFASSMVVLRLARYLWGYFSIDSEGRRWFIHGRWQRSVPR